MAEYTENLNLIKPAQDEQYNVDDFNDNFDKIDDFAGIVPPRALTADKLTTGAKINGVNFKGDTDIITGLGLYSDTNTYNNTNLAYLYDTNFKLRIFQSLQNANIGHNPLTNSVYWKEIQIGQKRNLGETVTCSLPIVDDNTLHLADGSLLSQQDYSEFINYIASIYVAPTYVTYYCWEDRNSGYTYFTLSSTPAVNDNVYDLTDIINGIWTVVGKVHQTYSQPTEIRIKIDSNYYTCDRSSSQDYTDTIFSQKFFTTEAIWQETYTRYGECGKYVYDSVNNTVRIPLYNSYFTNTVNPQKLGELTPASLPNIKGTVDNLLLQSSTATFDWTGAFYNAGIGGESVKPSSTTSVGTNEDNIGLDASRSSSVYSDTATTVNTQSIKQLVYIVVKV